MFLENKKLQHYSRFTDKRPSKAEQLFRTVRISLRKLLREPVFERGDANWLINYHQSLKSKMIPFIIQRKWLPLILVKNQIQKKSVPIFKIEEIDKNQSLN